MTLDELCRRRLANLEQNLEQQGVDALWVHPSVDLFYLTGLEPISLERIMGLVVCAGDDPRMVVPMLSRDECSGLGVELFAWDDAEGPGRAVASALDGVRSLTVLPSLPVWALQELRADAPQAAIEVDGGHMARARVRKDEHEAELIRRSGEVTDAVIEWIGTLPLEGLTERRLARLIQARYLELGHGPPEDTIVASGEAAAMPHYAGGDVAIDTAKPLLLDFGGLVEHYWSDTTRIYFPSQLDREMEGAYEVVLAAYDAALAKVGPGVPCAEVDRAARSVIEEAGHGEHFIHRTGHGLGLEIHEPPYLREGSEETLEVGHVFSIEPGIYVPGRFGVRYENIVYLGPNGPEEMNHTPKMHRFDAAI